jgi:hypothetical protein
MRAADFVDDANETAAKLNCENPVSITRIAVVAPLGIAPAPGKLKPTVGAAICA